MNTIIIPVLPTPDRNVHQLHVDFYHFDPHEGVKFAILLKNANDLTLDRTYVDLYGDTWQNWPSEATAEADISYIKNVVLQSMGLTEAVLVTSEE